MKKIVLFDTSIASLNRGDDIIMLSGRKELKRIIEGEFIVVVPSHTPAFQWYQTNIFSSLYKYMMGADYKFLCGTNLLYTNMLRPWPNWNINHFNSKPLKNTILVGVGSGVNSKNINLYTKTLYKKVLSKDYIHSVRDENTKDILEKLGFRAINTGCVTLWDLTHDLCKKIPQKKADSVIFTITDYAKDIENDQMMINILSRNYKYVYFWPQGSRDYDYFKTFRNTDKVSVLEPTVKAYSDFLINTQCDYVGTRLHGGIFAMKHSKRSIIIVVDHRAREMNKTYNLNPLDRKDLYKLEEYINSSIITDVKVDLGKIDEWYSQFC